MFTEKVLQARAATSAEANKALFERVCEACAKKYYSENSYRNHVVSQKHRLALAAAAPRQGHDDEAASVVSSTFSLGEPTADALDADAEDEFSQVVESLQSTRLERQRPSPVERPSNPRAADGDDDASMPTTTAAPEPAWTPESCLFCNYASPTVALNASHMERFHGMFIPERPYLADLDGLIKHLQSQVGQDHECLGCGKIKSTVFAVQTHMRDKGHCKIPFSTEEQQLKIGDFYDFRSTYSDDDSDSDATEADGGAKLGSRRRAEAAKDDGQEPEFDGDGDGDGWETDSSVSSLDSADLTAVPAEGHIYQFERLSKHAHHSRHDAGHRHQVDGWHSRAHRHTHAVFHDDYELHLPSGKSVGHRSLNRYFRQNLAHYTTPEERAQRLAIEGAAWQGDEATAGRQVATRDERGRALLPRGAEGMAGVADDKRRMAVKGQQRGRDAEQQRDKQRTWSYGKRANNQKTYYYRYDGGG